MPLKIENYKNFELGQYWANIKQGHNKEIYSTILSQNKMIKESYDTFIKNRH